MVRVKNLRAGYGSKVVIDDVSFNVESSKLVGLMGPNGSGKSTIIKAFFGIAKTFSGSISVLGKNTKSYTLDELSKTVAVQRPVKSGTIKLPLSAYVSLGLTVADKNRLDNVLQDFDLVAFRNTPISDLSDGTLQRASLAQTVIRDPKVYLLDEPTAHLDLKYKVKTFAEIKKRLGPQNCAVAVVHDTSLARAFCDWTVFLKDGRIFWQGEPKNITQELLGSLYDLEDNQIIL